MATPKSESLFHFTKNIESLKSILVKGLYPRYCLEDLSWFGAIDHLAYPMVSFCDIPLSRIDEHATFYGSYGIGFSKEWGLKNSLIPVIYVPNSGPVNDVVELLGDLKVEDNLLKGEILDSFFNLIQIIKPLKGQMIIGGVPIDKYFYQENEWRYTISNTENIWKNDFESKKDELNKKMEEQALEFSPTDIKYIFVADDADIPEIVDLINNNFGEYPLNDIKILTSRIISLNTVQTDL
jgi:hypothetical protein